MRQRLTVTAIMTEFSNKINWILTPHIQEEPLVLDLFAGCGGLKEIAWEKEVWFANEPDHMIHLNGNKFLEIWR